MFKLKNIFLTALISLFSINAVLSDADYCNVDECSNPSRHVMCLYPDKTTGASCDTVVRSGLSDNERTMIGFAHNLLRNAFSLQKGHNFSALVWDDELAELAQRWADQCPESDHNDECRSLNKFRTVVYQNVGKKSYPGNQPGQKSSEDISKLMSDIATEWYQQPHNPLKPDTIRYETINIVGCGLTKTSRCSLRGQTLPTCVDEFTIHLVCNYASKEDDSASKVEYDTVPL